jgi:hypothetical protein
MLWIKVSSVMKLGKIDRIDRWQCILTRRVDDVFSLVEEGFAVTVPFFLGLM